MDVEDIDAPLWIASKHIDFFIRDSLCNEKFTCLTLAEVKDSAKVNIIEI